jgi:hypothetical protein
LWGRSLTCLCAGLDKESQEGSGGGTRVWDGRDGPAHGHATKTGFEDLGQVPQPNTANGERRQADLRSHGPEQLQSGELLEVLGS